MVSLNEWLCGNSFSESKASEAPVNSITDLQCRWIEECTCENLWINSINSKTFLSNCFSFTQIFWLHFSHFVMSNYWQFYQAETLLRRMKLDLVSVYRWMRLDRHMVLHHCFIGGKFEVRRTDQSHNSLLLVYMCVCVCGLT